MTVAPEKASPLADPGALPAEPAAPRPHSALASAWKAWPGRLARIAFALLPLLYLSRKVALRDVTLRAADVGTVALLAAFAAAFGSNLVGSLRWQGMLRAYGAEAPPPVLTLLRHNLVGGYFNVLPSGVAGDAVRGLRVRQHLPSLATSYVVIFVERITGLVGLLLIAGATVFVSSELRAGPVAYTLDVGVLGALVLAALVLALPYAIARRPALRAPVARVPLAGPLVLRIPPARSLRGPLLAVALSILTQGAVVLSIAFLIGPLAPSATLLVCARIVPAIILFTYVPLTPGGLGQREAAFAYLFGLVGVPTAAAVATSLLFFAVSMALAALGGLCLLAERVTTRARP